MDFSAVELAPDVRAFWEEVRAFLDEHLTEAVHEEEWQTGAGHNVEPPPRTGGAWMGDADPAR